MDGEQRRSCHASQPLRYPELRRRIPASCPFPRSLVSPIKSEPTPSATTYRAHRPFRTHRSASPSCEGNSERTTAVTLPTGLADTRSQPLQWKEGLSTKGRGRVGRLGRSISVQRFFGASKLNPPVPVFLTWQCQTTAARENHRCPPHRNSGLGLKSGPIQTGSLLGVKAAV